MEKMSEKYQHDVFISFAHDGHYRKWTAPIRDWPLILKQLAIRFEDRWPV